jgi:crossover junction endodeoxyribonuclease RusA
VEKRSRVGVKVYLHGSTTTFGMDGDIDNYLKSALDGLNGIAYEDDRQITSVWAEKLRAEDKDGERMEIYLEEDEQ